jgi:hypothetical protein
VSNHIEIFRFEEGIDSIIAKVSAKTGLPMPAETPHEMRPRGYDSAQHGELEWDMPLVNLVRRIYAADIETFGYSPDP